MSDDQGERLRASRDRQVEKQQRSKLVQTLPSPFEAAVVGVSFTPTYPDNFDQLEQAWFQADLVGEALPMVVIRNPDNAYDPNACEVHVPSLGQYGMVGHITKALAARLAPELDAGIGWQGWVWYVKRNENYPDRPGLEVKLERRKT